MHKKYTEALNLVHQRDNEDDTLESQENDIHVQQLPSGDRRTVPLKARIAELANQRRDHS